MRPFWRRHRDVRSSATAPEPPFEAETGSNAAPEPEAKPGPRSAPKYRRRRPKVDVTAAEQPALKPKTAAPKTRRYHRPSGAARRAAGESRHDPALALEPCGECGEPIARAAKAPLAPAEWDDWSKVYGRAWRCMGCGLWICPEHVNSDIHYYNGGHYLPHLGCDAFVPPG